MSEPRRSLRPLGLALVCCVVLWTLVGVAIARAETPFTIGKPSALVSAEKEHEYEPSATAATQIYVYCVDSSSSETVVLYADGVEVAAWKEATGALYIAYSYVLGAAQKFKLAFTGATCEYAAAEVKGGEGPAGKEGKEGPAGKEGPPGAEGKAGAAGASGAEVREISEEDVLYLLGGLAIATCVFLVSKVVMP